MSAIPSSIRKAIIDRDFDRCSRCSAKGSEIQHRVRRREGGHRKSNLIRMCFTCHQTWAHTNPLDAQRAGIVVPTWLDPQDVPVRTWRGWVTLSDDGTIHPMSPASAEALIERLLGPSE